MLCHRMNIWNKLWTIISLVPNKLTDLRKSSNNSGKIFKIKVKLKLTKMLTTTLSKSKSVELFNMVPMLMVVRDILSKITRESWPSKSWCCGNHPKKNLEQLLLYLTRNGLDTWVKINTSKQDNRTLMITDFLSMTIFKNSSQKKFLHWDKQSKFWID